MTLSLRVVIAAVAMAAFVLPIIIVRAQAEAEGEQAAGDVIVEQTEVVTTAEGAADNDAQAVIQGEVAADQTDDTSIAAAEEESVLGAEATGEEAAAAEQSTEQVAAISDTSSETAAQQTEDGAVTEIAAATTSPSEPAVIAETGATSTAPVVDPPAAPVEEPFVLQPAVKLHVNGSSVAADIGLDNLTCKRCGKTLPALWVKAYYTAWYPNDGPEYKEGGAHLSEQEVNVSNVGLWGSRAMSWSANDVAPGRYYFIVVVDAENANGAYRMHRTEFAI